MPFRVSGKNIDIGEALRTRINARIIEATTKYFDGGCSGHVAVGKEAYGFRTECVIHLDSGIVLEAEAFAADAYASADQAAERIEKRLRRYKRRLKGHPTRAEGHAFDDNAIAAPSYVIATPEHDEDAGEFTPVIIAETTTALKRLSVSEAVMELDLTGVAAVVFRHAGHGRVNVVYRRADGHIGWVDPPALAANAVNDVPADTAGNPPNNRAINAARNAGGNPGNAH
jgi:ribosomal subunit interface protein